MPLIDIIKSEFRSRPFETLLVLFLVVAVALGLYYLDNEIDLKKRGEILVSITLFMVVIFAKFISWVLRYLNMEEGGGFADLNKKIKDIESLVNDVTVSEVTEELKQKLLSYAEKMSSEEFIHNLKNKIEIDKNEQELELLFEEDRNRFMSEIDALTRRGNFNLVIGIVTALIGVSVLIWSILAPLHTELNGFLYEYMPRISLVIVIEIFAYFFLQLYKSSLTEIKYYQNEMTNLQAKLAAIKLSMKKGDDKTLAEVILKLVSTERNAILKKGETTAEIEKYRIEQQNVTNLSNKLSELLSNNSRPNK